MAETNLKINEVVLESTESRKGLAALAVKLFQLWGLSTSDQLDLLGLSPKSRSMLSKYARGEALPATRDMYDRVGWLLAIHKALRLLYPRNEEIRYSWVNRRNAAFDNLAPLEVMKEQGIIGIARVARYLDFYRGR
ncbi:MAG: MbcA/ParS/Xre antitoxin family protein [Desulfobacteraceae bacterium]|nr:MbcA/ParS/Xre antitoxin family protein [Desulfobacteraceae bacterium]